MNLQISKWGNSLAMRLPHALVKSFDLKEKDLLTVSVDSNGAIMLRPSQAVRVWNKKDFFARLRKRQTTLKMGTSVMQPLKNEARY